MAGDDSPAARALAAAMSGLEPQFAVLDWQLDFAARLARSLRRGEIHGRERPVALAGEFLELARATARAGGGELPAGAPPAAEMLWLVLRWATPALAARGLTREAAAIDDWKRAFAPTPAGASARDRFFEYMGIQDVHAGAPPMPLYAHHLVDRVQAALLAAR